MLENPLGGDTVKKARTLLRFLAQSIHSFYFGIGGGGSKQHRKKGIPFFSIVEFIEIEANFNVNLYITRPTAMMQQEKTTIEARLKAFPRLERHQKNPVLNGGTNSILFVQVAYLACKRKVAATVTCSCCPKMLTPASSCERQNYKHVFVPTEWLEKKAWATNYSSGKQTFEGQKLARVAIS